MTTEKKLLFVNQDEIDRQVSALDSEIKRINTFLTSIKDLAGVISKDQYRYIVNDHGEINFNFLNEIVFNKVLDSKPTLKALCSEVDKEDVKKFAKVEEFTQSYQWNIGTPNTLDLRISANILTPNSELWTIGKDGKALLMAGAKDAIIENNSFYTTSETELIRLDICNDIAKLMLKLQKLSSNPEKFDLTQKVLMMQGGKPVADYDFIYRGIQAGERYPIIVAPFSMESTKPAKNKKTIGETLKENGFFDKK